MTILQSVVQRDTLAASTNRVAGDPQDATRSIVSLSVVPASEYG
jgi:hypothetical protein